MVCQQELCPSVRMRRRNRARPRTANVARLLLRFFTRTSRAQRSPQITNRRRVTMTIERWALAIAVVLRASWLSLRHLTQPSPSLWAYARRAARPGALAVHHDTL